MASTLTSFTSGDLVISIVGNGAGTGNYTDNQGTPITLMELTTTGTVVGQLVLPQTTTVVNGTTEYAISGEYGSSSEGSLELSQDGQSLTIAGYGINAATYNSGGAAVYGNAALAQTTSLTGGTYTAVARVVADISYNTAIDTSTALYNVYNTNNPRSVATINGTTFYLSGQGVKGDTTQGVFVTKDGSGGATAIDTSTDTRTVEISNGQLYVSRDSTQGSGGTSNIATYGAALPSSATAATPLPGINGKVTLTAGQQNGVNNSAVGTTVNLSPENYFFANATTLYIADSGNPKQGGLGDGGLQKWVLSGGTWTLAYTLSTGLNLVADTNSSGSTGLIGLTGVVNGGTVQLFTTNSTLGDLDQTYLYSITDTLSATTLPGNEAFTTLMTAAADTNIRGIAFAPSAAPAGSATTVGAGATSTGLTVNSGGSLAVGSGGAVVSATILSGAVETVAVGGTDSGTIIGHGATQTLLGVASGTQVEGTQILSAATATLSNATVYNGGAVDLYLKGATATGVTLTNGGALNISGNATATNTIISSGGQVSLQSAKAVLSGGLTFVGAGTLSVSAISSAGFGDLAVISGFGVGDVVDVTAIAPGATLSTAVVSGNTVATITSGAVSQSFTFAGSVASSLQLVNDPTSGVQIVYNAPTPTSTTVSSGVTSTGITVSSGGSVTVLSGGSLVSATLLSGGTGMIAGSDAGTVISAGATETVLGTASGDAIYGVQIVSAATATVTSETVYSGGALDLYLKGATATGTVVSGGTLNISGNATAVNTTLTGGGVLALQSPKAVVSGALTFAGAGTLVEMAAISGGFGDLGVISGFGTGDAVDVTVIGTGATLSGAVVSGNTVETITSAGVSQAFTFAGTYAAGYFSLTPDSSTGVQIVAAGTPCYCPGTLITTGRGEVPVETLAIGDRVRTASGALRPIKWIGRRAYAGRFAAGQTQILPVRIAAGALAAGQPRRDLFVSPLHAMLLDGVLVPAVQLVNGTSIVQLDQVERVDYAHVELETHDVILAEGAPSETFLDDGSRGMFHNAAEFAALYPGAVAQPARYCAPRVEEGAVLDAIRRRIAARATPELAAWGALQGSVDVAAGGRIAGWARDVAAPGQAVRLQVLADGVVLREVVADAYRADLAAAGLGDGRHGFDIVIPGGLPQDADIRIVRLADGAALPERRAA